MPSTAQDSLEVRHPYPYYCIEIVIFYYRSGILVVHCAHWPSAMARWEGIEPCVAISGHTAPHRIVRHGRQNLFTCAGPPLAHPVSHAERIHTHVHVPSHAKLTHSPTSTCRAYAGSPAPHTSSRLPRRPSK